ncbi:MAG TPA: alpha/beta hydrolase [Stellaceae bacterium]
MSSDSPESDPKPAPRRRNWLLGAVGLLLLGGACVAAGGPGPEFASIAAPRTAIEGFAAPQFTESAFIVADGAQLPLRKWLPNGAPKAVILALHGFGDYSHAFEEAGKLWAARGIATYAYDQRGFGGAPGRGIWPGEGPLAIDAISAVRILRQAYPGRPLYLLGESMGGAVATVAATGVTHGMLPSSADAPIADADGVILSAPAVWGRDTMDLLPKVALWAGARFLPTAVLSGQGLRIQASDNLPMLRELGRDPMVIKGARIDTVFGLVNLMDSALDAAPRLSKPMLLMYGEHDQIVPAPAIQDFVAHLPPDPEHRHERLAFYQKGWHLLLRDLEGPIVAEDVANWIFYQRAPLPSHADAAQDTRPWPPESDKKLDRMIGAK